MQIPLRNRAGLHHFPLITCLLIATPILLHFGCADPAPKMVPAAPIRVDHAGDGAEERVYDTHHDGKADYYERLGKDGRVALLRFDFDGDGKIDEEVDRTVRRLESEPPDRQLVVILDSVPYPLVREFYEQGRFRLFYPPSRTIPPFPVMTDVALAEFFETSPSLGAESQYYADSKLTGGYTAYAHERNACGWLAYVDYHMRFVVHAIAYFWPHTWFDHEMGNIQRQFYKADCPLFVGYVVCTSALGAQEGSDGHRAGLVRLDRFCQAVTQRLRGRVQITLLSDHGHYLLRSRRIPLPEILKRMGYHVTEKLKGPQDVAIPEFGVVSCATIYTQSAASVARDLLGVEGVEHTAYLNENGEVVVASRTGRARIVSGPSGIKYECDYGDPLELNSNLKDLRSKGAMDAQGFVEDRTLFEATIDHTYPDAPHRLWRAFHGLIENQPDVYVSSQDGYHCGSPLMSRLVDLRGSHGNLRQASSSGFAMTTTGVLPPVLRIADLRAELVKLGVPLHEAPTSQKAE